MSNNQSALLSKTLLLFPIPISSNTVKQQTNGVNQLRSPSNSNNQISKPLKKRRQRIKLSFLTFKIVERVRRTYLLLSNFLMNAGIS
jgi:hypothetical protein